MNLRRIIIFVSVAACLAALALVLIRQRQIADLRTQRQDLMSQAPLTLDTLSEANSNNATGTMAQPRPSYAPSLELLRLRGEVTRLENRKRELANSRMENERLRLQIAARGTNTPAGLALPPDYLRKSEAQFAGYDTPEHTLQTMLWAVRNRDFTNLLAVFTPEVARELEHQIQRSGKSAGEFLDASWNFPFLRVAGRNNKSDGTVELKIAPGMSDQPIRFRIINGEWKMDSH